MVAFGQPAWSPFLGLLCAIGGFACFWRALLSMPHARSRFWVAMGWYAAVQVVQLSWLISHPYFYIYGVLLFCACLMGAQWGLLALFIRPQTIERWSSLFALAGCWTLLEWSRLFLLTGLPFNPVGLSLSGALYPLQGASLGGVYGLSFWVILTNLFLLKAWMGFKHFTRWGMVFFVAGLPYAFGFLHLSWHLKRFEQEARHLKVLLVQTALPIEEKMVFQSAEEAHQFVLGEWRHILSLLAKHQGKGIDLILFPENLVPYGTFYAVFPLPNVHAIFRELFGKLPDPLPVHSVRMPQGGQTFVSNAYWAQLIANVFQAHVVIGLEDDDVSEEEGKISRTMYSAAFHFIPNHLTPPERYEKQVLVPMGEYIPFEWCRKMAASYGISGSFSCGKGAKLFSGPIPFGASICYEEIYGEMMRANRVKGAEVLVNLTNDGWYPQSRLPKQHFDHARLRTVENGIPLVRACNTGVTGAIDSLGRLVGVLDEDHMRTQERAEAVYLDVPLYHYKTLYSQVGDQGILGLALLSIFWPLGIYLKNLKNRF